MKIAQFPDDDALWLVKWIDQFRSPHGSTRTASVSVLLQKLPLSRANQLNRLTRKEVADALRLVDASEQVGQLDAEFLEPYPRIHVGTLPHVAIGRVFQRQECVGELPSRIVPVELPLAEDSCREVRIDEDIQAPSGWNPTYPYHLLHAREYKGIQKEFGRSRCLVFIDQASGIEFVIPRTTIFKRFYAAHTEIALAFTSGNWSSTRARLIYEEELENGLLTQIDPHTGDWHIILTTHVPFGFEKLLAILRFDSFGFQCAESIYATALKDRGMQPTNPWYASARLPFHAEEKPLRLCLKGFDLHPRYGRRPRGEGPVELKKSFLVTSIVECSWPSYIPTIRHERYNSGEGSDEPEEVHGDRPYREKSRRTHVGTNASIGSDDDSSAGRDGYFFVDDDFAWTDAPDPIKLVKESSKHYVSNSEREALPPTDASSTGEPNSKAGSPSKMQIRSLVRDPVNRFKYLLQALEEIKARKEPEIEEFWVVQPPNPSQIAHRGGVICWNFLDSASRTTCKWPRTGWRMLERARRSESESSCGIPRCALVIGLTRKGRTGYWVEIECRPTEQGYLSPFLMLDYADEQEALDHVIEAIASVSGQGLRPVVASTVAALRAGKAACYLHRYVSADDATWNTDSIVRFFQRCWC